jgi:hypothetical protein
MLAHAKDIKERHPNAKVIFLGPCISKKNEIEMYPGLTDCVLTFLELERFFKEKGISPKQVAKPGVSRSQKPVFSRSKAAFSKRWKKTIHQCAYLEISGLGWRSIAGDQRHPRWQGPPCLHRNVLLFRELREWPRHPRSVTLAFGRRFGDQS